MRVLDNVIDKVSEAPRREAATAVEVCVCTYHRPQVADTLRSLAAQCGPGAERFRVIVSDNAAEPTARASILSVASELGLEIVYTHAPSNNISIARNACLDAASGEWIAFLDDDEVAAPAWLSALMATAKSGGWDAVLGPVKADYPATIPEWVRSGDFHSQGPTYVRGRIETGYTGNVLIRRSFIANRNIRFKIELGRTGGEDVDFFYQLSDAGGRIGYSPEAVAYSAVAPDRASLKWILKRSFRSGQSHGSRLDAQTRNPAVRSCGLAIALAKASVCAAAAVAHLPHAGKRCRYLARATMHCGVAARLAGLREIRCY